MKKFNENQVIMDISEYEELREAASRSNVQIYALANEKAEEARTFKVLFNKNGGFYTYPFGYTDDESYDMMRGLTNDLNKVYYEEFGDVRCSRVKEKTKGKNHMGHMLVLRFSPLGNSL